MPERHVRQGLLEEALSRRVFLTRTLGAGVAIGGLGLVGLSGCESANSGGGGTTEGGVYKGQQAVSHLDDIISPAPFHVAQKEGYFKDAKLELTSVSFPGGADVIRAVQTRMKIGLGATIATLIAHQKGLSDVRIVGGMMNKSEVLFMAPAKSPIEGPEDLNGKKIGVSEPGSNTTYFANQLIKKYNLEGAKIVNVGGPPDAIAAAEHGVVDVGWGAPPFTTKLEEEGKARVVVDTAELEPRWASTCLVTLSDFADENPEVLRGWIGALGKAVDLIHSDPERAGRDWAESVDIDPKVATTALEEYSDAFTIAIDREAIQSGIRAGKVLGQIEGEPNVDEIVDDQFLPTELKGK